MYAAFPILGIYLQNAGAVKIVQMAFIAVFTCFGCKITSFANTPATGEGKFPPLAPKTSHAEVVLALR